MYFIFDVKGLAALVCTDKFESFKFMVILMKGPVSIGFSVWAFVCVLFCNGLALAQDGKESADTPDLFIAFGAPLPDVATTSPVGTVAHTVGAINALREDHPHIIYLHGGSALGPSILSNYDKGVHAIELTNLLAPDVYIASRGDYAYGDDQVSIRTREAAFPIVSANTIDRETGQPAEGLLRSVILERDQYRIGIVGTISPFTTSTFETLYTEVGDPLVAVDEESKRLRQAGSDLIIAVLDAGEPGVKALRDANVDVDAIIQYEPLAETRDNQGAADFYVDTERGDILFASATKKEDSWDWQSRIISQTDFAPDPEAQASIDRLLQRFERILNIPVVTADISFDTREPVVRTRESGFANLVADVLREETGADIAFVNAGQIRGATVYDQGEVLTRKDIQTELPFRDSTVTVQLSGQEVIDALEHGVSRVESVAGLFLHVSNMSYGFNPAKPRGQRLTFVRYGGDELDPNASLSVAMTNFIAEGGDGYSMLQSAPRLARDQSFILWERVMNNLRGRQDVSFAAEGRIIRIE